jgi:methyl-accepting chemotaxis protein
MTLIGALAQADVRAADALDRIATAQFVMAAVMVLIGLIVLALGVLLLLQIRAARRQLSRTVDELRPQLAPLVDRARHVTNDVAGMSDNVRRKVDDVLHTVEELRRSLERARAATEERAARFVAVLDVVQEETEDLMLDAAATAHGVQETARVLREPRSRRGQDGVGRRVVHADEDEEELA